MTQAVPCVVPPGAVAVAVGAVGALVVLPGVELGVGLDFALTGAVYSRSPRNLQQARKDFRVGNLYLNRPCTGALVHRQPFGGFKMSGAGTKAGGPGYLFHFAEMRVCTENTMRRGFTPETL